MRNVSREIRFRKVKGVLGEGESERLVEVSREVNRMRRRLKREYFDQRLGEIGGDMRATWEVLGRFLGGAGGGEMGRRVGTLRVRGLVSRMGMR